MRVSIHDNKLAMGAAAAREGAEAIRFALQSYGTASIIVATGASQFEMLQHLTEEPDIAWDKVTGFHLDEYVGLPVSHGASFRLYLWQRFVSKLPVPMRAFHFIDAETAPEFECKRLGDLIRQHSVDVAFVGIGENGHLAFNDPPADFETEDPYLIVELDAACRQQQIGEGWFPDADSVPRTAISMSVRQIMKSKKIICTVPDRRKAQAVRSTVDGPVSPDAPASILQNHGNTTLYLDAAAASLLRKGEKQWATSISR